MLDTLIFKKHLEEGERIVYAVHKHWVAIFKSTLSIFIFGFSMPWVLYLIAFSTPTFFWVAMVWSCIAILRFMYLFVDWYADAFLVTNMAIVWVNWGGFFRSAATRMGFEDIEGVAYEITGFWSTILNYGVVNLKSVSGNVLTLKPARRPKEVELKIMAYQQSYIRDREMEDTGKLKHLLAQMVSSHFRRESK